MKTIACVRGDVFDAGNPKFERRRASDFNATVRGDLF